MSENLVNDLISSSLDRVHRLRAQSDYTVEQRRLEQPMSQLYPENVQQLSDKLETVRLTQKPSKSSTKAKSSTKTKSGNGDQSSQELSKSSAPKKLGKGTQMSQKVFNSPIEDKSGGEDQSSQEPLEPYITDKSEDGDGDSDWTLILSDETSHLDTGKAEPSFSHDTNRMFTKCLELYENNTCLHRHEANIFAETLSTFLSGWNTDLRPTSRLPLRPDNLQFVLCKTWNERDCWTLILLESNAETTTPFIVGGGSVDRCSAVYEFQKLVEGMLWENLRKKSPRALIC